MLAVRDALVRPHRDFHQGQEARIPQRVVRDGLAVFVHRRDAQVEDEGDIWVED